MSKVSKTFVASMNKRLYSRPRASQIDTNILTLVQFTRTIISNPGLASLIHTLDLGHLRQEKFISEKRVARLKDLSRDSTFRHAIKRLPVVYLFRNFESIAALLDDFYANLQLPNLQKVTLRLWFKFDNEFNTLEFNNQIARTQSIDQLSPRHLPNLKDLSVFSMGFKTGWGSATCPKVVTSPLRIPYLQAYSTDHLISKYLPLTEITTLDTNQADRGRYLNPLYSSRSFFHGADKVKTLMLDSDFLRYLYQLRPEQVTQLVLYEPEFMDVWYELKAEPFLKQLESLHLHGNIIDNADTPLTYSHTLNGPRHPDSWIKLLGASLRTLCIFDMADLLHER